MAGKGQRGREEADRLAAIEYAQGSIAHLAPDRDLAEELVTERRSRIKAAIKANRETLRRLAK